MLGRILHPRDYDRANFECCRHSAAERPGLRLRQAPVPPPLRRSSMASGACRATAVALLGLLVLSNAVLPGKRRFNGGLQSVCASDCHAYCCGRWHG